MCLGCNEHTQQLGPEGIQCPSQKCSHREVVQHAVQRTKLEMCCCIPCGDHRAAHEVAYCPECKWSAASPQRWPGALEGNYRPQPQQMQPTQSMRPTMQSQQRSGKW